MYDPKVTDPVQFIAVEICALLNDSSEAADSVARAPILTVVCVFSWCEKAHTLSTKTFV